jgi:hypothetical protein
MNNTIIDFIKSIAFSGVAVPLDSVQIQDLGCPHIPKSLPSGKMAVYAFEMNGVFLKIGKAGAKSGARFRSQHYSPTRANSNLAKSLLADATLAHHQLNNQNIEEWIKNNVRRIDILIDKELGMFVLNFLEAFLHCKFQPQYEGFENQRNQIRTSRMTQ